MWLLLSLVLGIKQNNMQSIYGKHIADEILPNLLKEHNTEYFLEKYNYYSDD